MKITFLLSGWTTVPVGGYKIVYEYANRLAERGHSVSLVHPLDLDNAHGILWRSCLKFRKTAGTLARGTWFALHQRAKFMVVPTLEEKHIPIADKIIATDWVPANWIAGYGPDKGDKYYFIQVWLKDMPGVDRSWKLALKKIVCSRWLQEKAREFGEDAHVVPSGLDTEMFRIRIPIERRDPCSIGMLYHTAPYKAFDDGFKAVTIVKGAHPKVSLKLFGVFPRPGNLPEWVTYVRNPPREELVRLYNSISIFVNSSLSESWGLPPAEAMACGCAVAATNNGGILEYAEHGVSALISPISSPERLAENIIQLIENDEKRILLARKGNDRIRQFTWDRAIESFEGILSGKVGADVDGIRSPAGAGK